MNMLRTLLLHPLGPALILALGGLLVRMAGANRWPGPRGYAAPRRSWLSLLIALGSIGAAAMLLVLLRTGAPRSSIGWTWQPLTVAGGVLEWRLDGWSWLATLLVTLLALVAAVLEAVEPQDVSGRPRTASGRTLWLAGAAACFVSSANLLTLATCWVLLDLALALRLRADEHAEPAGRAWSALSLTAVVVLLVLAMLGESHIRSPLAAGTFGQLDLMLLWAAGLVRAGIYPLHGWLIGAGPTTASDRVALHLMAPTAGLWLLAQVYRVGGAQWLHRPEWVALSALALLGTAIAAWTADDRDARWRWIAVNRAALMIMAVYVADVAAPPALAWVMVTFSLAGALLAVGPVGGKRWIGRLPGWLAAMALWGLPGTTGFLARSALILPTGLPVAAPLFFTLVVAESLLAAALWRAAAGEATSADGIPVGGSRPSRVTVLALGLAAVLLAVPILYWGLLPGRLAALVGLPMDNSFPSLAWALTHTRRSVWLGLAVSGLLGVILGVLHGPLFASVRGWQRITHYIVSLEWLYRGLAAGIGAAGAALRYFAVLGEGEGYLGWLALATLVLWLLLRG